MNKVYSKDGIYIEELEDGLLRLGLSAYGSDSVGDVSYFAFLEEASIVKDRPYFSVEGSKAVTDMIAPISGEIVEKHDALVEDPDLLNTDNEAAKWTVIVKPSEAVNWDQFLTEDLPTEDE